MKKWDIEYSTQYNPEKEFLKKHNITPSFVKDVDGITTYKYKKRIFFIGFIPIQWLPAVSMRYRIPRGLPL